MRPITNEFKDVFHSWWWLKVTVFNNSLTRLIFRNILVSILIYSWLQFPFLLFSDDLSRVRLLNFACITICRRPRKYWGKVNRRLPFFVRRIQKVLQTTVLLVSTWPFSGSIIFFKQAMFSTSISIICCLLSKRWGCVWLFFYWIKRLDWREKSLIMMNLLNRDSNKFWRSWLVEKVTSFQSRIPMILLLLSWICCRCKVGLKRAFFNTQMWIVLVNP